MHRLLILFLFLPAAGFSVAQESRTVVTGQGSISDSKPNSADIPDAYTIGSTFDRIVVVRIKHKNDLLAGLTKAIKDNAIRSAVILSGIGSVTSYHYHVVGNTAYPTANIFVKNPVHPADLVSMNGYIINGRVHAHATFSNADRAFGGHLEPGTSVYTFAIVTIGILGKDADLSRVDDKDYR